MPVKVKCPNQRCERTLRIKDKYAGRRGRCPFCGTKIEVPDLNGVLPSPIVNWQHGANDDEDQLEGFEIIEEDDEEESTLQEKGRSEEDGGSGAELVEEPDSARGSKRRARAQTSARSAKKAAVEREGPPSSVSASKPGKRPRPRPAFGDPKPDTNAAIIVVTGAVLLVALGLSPFFDWFRAGGGGGSTSVVGASLLEGKCVVGVSLLSAVFVVAAVALYCFLDVNAGNDVVAAGAAVAGGWGTAAAVWLGAWLWKSVGTYSAIRNIVSRPGAMPVMPSLPPGNPLSGHSYAPDLTLSVGPGIWIGLTTGLFLFAIVTHLLGTRQRGGGLLVCPGAGVLTGIALLVFNVRPWENFMPTR